VNDDGLGFEPLDDELGRRLRAAAPTAPATEGALTSLRPRFEQARRRRRAAVTGAWGVGAVGALGLVLTLAVPGDGDGVRTPPAKQPDATTTTTVAPVPSTVPTPVTPGTVDDNGGDRPDGSDDNDGGASGSGSGSGSDD
jgi:hypothetical protein